MIQRENLAKMHVFESELEWILRYITDQDGHALLQRLEEVMFMYMVSHYDHDYRYGTARSYYPAKSGEAYNFNDPEQT
jgi:hypothetical protein